MVISCSKISAFCSIYARKCGNLHRDVQLWISIVQWRWQIEKYSFHYYFTLCHWKVQTGSSTFSNTNWLCMIKIRYFLSRILWHVWGGHTDRSPTDRLYKIILWNKFGRIRNHLGHSHANFWIREMLLSEITHPSPSLARIHAPLLWL